jgi:hypothetical protein
MGVQQNKPLLGGAALQRYMKGLVFDHGFTVCGKTRDSYRGTPSVVKDVVELYS